MLKSSADLENQIIYVCWLHKHLVLGHPYDQQAYCKSGNFPENFIFANSVKRHSCGAKISRLVHDLPISVMDRVISRGFYFHENLHMQSFAKIKPSRKFPILQYLTFAVCTFIYYKIYGPMHNIMVLIAKLSLNAHSDISSMANGLNFGRECSSTSILCVCEQQRLWIVCAYAGPLSTIGSESYC